MSADGFKRGFRVLRHRGPRAAAHGALDEIRSRFEHRREIRRGPRRFVVDGVKHLQLAHPYNRTWRNERAVEVPLALAFLADHDGPVLEVGDVLGNYGRRGHTVVDRYEPRAGVEHVDVVDYNPSTRYGAIVAISTIEHVGWDEEPRDPEKADRALRHLRSLLVPTGRLFVSAPLGHNPGLDRLISDGVPGTEHQTFLVREGAAWLQVGLAEASARASFGQSPSGSNTVWLAELGP